jgi:UDP-GlcNAc:undecaprenyl-phosphate GlcNAc-1-phosphate transferase
VLIYSYILAAFIAIIVALLTTPLAIKIGNRLGAKSSSRDIEIERAPVPYLGGFAVIFSIFVAIIAAFLIYRNPFLGYNKAMIAIFAGTAVMFVVGYIDDRYDLRAGTKFIVQIIVALITALLGVKISTISNPFNSVFDLGALSIPITVFWIVGITNAVNFVDGLDGLATGVLSIASISLAMICISLNLPFLAIIFLAVFGGTAGFLCFNYPPARIILGNNGAYALGFIFATASIVQPVKVSAVMVLFVPILALGFPIMEIVITVARRLFKRKKVYQRDTEHLHHLLLSFGLPPSVVDWIFYSMSFLFATVAVVLSVGNRSLMIVFLIGLLIIFSILTVKLASLERRKERR